MKKDTELLMAKLEHLDVELAEIKKIVSLQSEQIEFLKKQINQVATVKIEENGKKSVESFGNVLLDEIISLKKKLGGFSAEGLRNAVNDLAEMKNKALNGDGEISLSELKSELLKLADMMIV